MAGSTVAKNDILQINLTNLNKPSWESVTDNLKVPGSTKVILVLHKVA